MTGPAPISVQLFLGDAPASDEIMEALERIEITLTDQVPSGIQLVFALERSPTSPSDPPIVANSLLQPMTRVQVTASPSGMPEVLFDGFLVHQELQPRSGSQAGTFTVTGEDLSVVMDLIQLTIPWPAMTDLLVAGAVLAKYLVYGVIPSVSVSPGTLSAIDPDPDAIVQQQSAETDRALLQRLAGIHGNRFYIIPGPTRGHSSAYWGPPKYDDPPSATLSVDDDGATNAVQLSFQYNHQAPTLYNGLVQNTFLGDMDLPVATVGSSRTPLSTRPALSPLSPYARRSIVEHAGLDWVRTMMRAQQQTDDSTDSVATASGSIDTLRSRTLIKAGTLVAVRGAGSSNDGAWYVNQVVHRIDARSYTQQVSLQRDGLGSTLSAVSPS